MTVGEPEQVGDVVVVREDDPAAVALLADGWTIASESWGARLTVDDPAVVAD